MHHLSKTPFHALPLRIRNTYYDNVVWNGSQITLKETSGPNELYICARITGSGSEPDKYTLRLLHWDLHGTPFKVDMHGCFRYLWTRTNYNIQYLKKKEVLNMLVAFIFPTVTTRSVEEIHHLNLSGHNGYKIFQYVLKLLHHMTGYVLLLDHSYSALDIFNDEYDHISIASKSLKFISKDGMSYRLESVILDYQCSYGNDY